MKTITRIMHVDMPFSESSIIGACTAVSGVRGVDIGDGKKYKFVGIRNFKNELMPGGCLKPKVGRKKREYFRESAHIHQSYDMDLEEIPDDSLTTGLGRDTLEEVN